MEAGGAQSHVTRPQGLRPCTPVSCWRGDTCCSVRVLFESLVNPSALCNPGFRAYHLHTNSGVEGKFIS